MWVIKLITLILDASKGYYKMMWWRCKFKWYVQYIFFSVPSFTHIYGILDLTSKDKFSSTN